MIACHKCTKHAIETVVVKLIRGEIPDVSKSFAPGPAELSAALRSEMDFVSKQVELAENRLQLEHSRDTRNATAPRLTYAERVAAARQRMVDEGRRELFPVPSNEAFMAKRKEIPVGGVYVNILDAAFGPPGSLHFKPEPRQPAPQAAPEMADIEF